MGPTPRPGDLIRTTTGVTAVGVRIGGPGRGRGSGGRGRVRGGVGEVGEVQDRLGCFGLTLIGKTPAGPTRNPDLKPETLVIIEPTLVLFCRCFWLSGRVETAVVGVGGKHLISLNYTTNTGV